MKKIPLLLSLVCIMLLGLGCKKSDLYTTTFRGKIVLLKCGSAAINVEGATGTAEGIEWTDNQNTKYNNAVTVNYCYLVSLGLKEGDAVNFKVSKTDIVAVQPCAIEKCLINGPVTSVYIYDAQKVN